MNCRFFSTLCFYSLAGLTIVFPISGTFAQTNPTATVSAEEQKKRDELRQKYGKRSAESPVVEHVSQVAPDMLAVSFVAGRFVSSQLSSYVKQNGDEVKTEGDATILRRNGQDIAWLVGHDKKTMVTFEALEGDPLLEFLLDDKGQFTIRGNGAFQNGVKPITVYRKSKPINWTQPARGFVMRHTAYLKLPAPLTPGQSYTVELGDINARQARVEFKCDPMTVRSEAVHALQIGFRPDDPLKRAFLSLWAGTGGALTYPENTTFHLVEDKTSKPVFTGKVATPWPADRPEKLNREENFNKTHVYTLDFSSFNKPGRYRVAVEGVGCSFPFEISGNTWEAAFKTQMRGFFNNRSGVELGPPYTSFKKPRDFHPDDTPVLETTHSVLDGGIEAGEKLTKGSTGKSVPGAWGGWHDAGDFNPRRVTHMKASLLMMELLEMYPQKLRSLKWNLPPTAKTSDLMKEVLFELDVFRRIQKPDGGVPHAIETPGDPKPGEVSWAQSYTTYVLAPDAGSSFFYAGVAARAARLLAIDDANLAKTYRESALKAAEWAEAQRKARPEGFPDERALASIELYKLTGDKKWLDGFKESSVLKEAQPDLTSNWGRMVQRDATFAYATLPDSQADSTWKQKAIAAFDEQGRKALEFARNNAWGIANADPSRPMMIGYFSTPFGAVELVRAHYLTKKPEYLTATLQACLFPGGANPTNHTFTTGVGANPVRNPLHLDSRRTGQPVPEGFTPYGIWDFKGHDQEWANWPLKYYIGQATTPTVWDWPLTEAYFDVFLYPATNEWTMDQTMGLNAYVWGYLAVR